MPKAVELVRNADQLCVGDVIKVVGHLKGHVLCGRAIESIELKTKLAHITPARGVKVSIPLSTQVLFVREFPTDEETEAKERARALYFIKQSIANAPDAVEEAQAKLLKDLAYVPSYWAHQIASLAEATAQAQLWARVERAAAAGTYRGSGSFEVGDLIAATRAVAAEIKEQMMDLRPTSRSTSVLHNAMEDVELEARLSWFRSLIYRMADL
jgi:hypothetical protein